MDVGNTCARVASEAPRHSAPVRSSKPPHLPAVLFFYIHSSIFRQARLLTAPVRK